jgi:S1-C subfamily serine protease
MKGLGIQKLGIAAAVVILLIIGLTGGAVSERIFGYKLLDKWWPRLRQDYGGQAPVDQSQKIVNEENVVIDVAEKASESVVTVGIKKTQVLRQPNYDIFGDEFGFFGPPSSGRSQTRKIEQDIGTGFVISADGLIVTNRHVVSETDATYNVVTKDNKSFVVKQIYRDPTNDLAIIKVDASGLAPIALGDSDKLKVGQLAIAIGTALGEFRHTVTTGVVSGLGRGITAGSPFAGEVERLDNVIQTDAAINPGNSGGPLLNSAGQVIGINTAVSSEGQNIGFAIPINVVKEAIENFNNTGKFSRPFLGVSFRVVDQKTALLNEVPQGAYIQSVVEDSPAEKAGIQEGDIVTKIGGVKLEISESGLAKAIATHKVGERVEIELWRDGETKMVTVTLEETR